MIIKWVYITLLFTLTAGICLYLQVSFPWFLKWIGTLPGDLVLTDHKQKFFFPFASCSAIGLLWCLIFRR